MAAKIEIIPAKAKHIRAIASNMRQADRDEVMASSSVTPFEALAISLRKSTLSRTVLVDGIPAAMFGVADINILTGVGAPWLLGTDAVVENYVSFLRLSVDWRNQLLMDYSYLRNFVDGRNRASVRWLKWLGFEFSDPISVNGIDFYLFEKRA